MHDSDRRLAPGETVTEGGTVTMAQTSSAQREPSMEEILASIRRIIEDSDEARQTDDAHSALEAGIDDAYAAQVGIEPEPFREPEPAAREVEVFRQGIAGEDASASAEPAEAPASMSEIQASIGRDPVNVLDIHAFQSADAADGRRRASAVQGMEPARDDQSPAPVPPVTDAPAWSDSDMPEAENSAAPRAATSPSTEAASILSEQAGRQVAAAFGELSEAFAASRRRSFDDMAMEMMRPMLQDWLDNNLPTLVEKLVREEIERVARGE